MKTNRIEMEDTLQDIIQKLSEENSGAQYVTFKAFQESLKTDPYAILGGISPLLALDTYGIYGSNIWLLYKDRCNEDIVLFLAVLRSCQMGILDKAELLFKETPFDKETTLKALQAVLPKFNNENK